MLAGTICRGRKGKQLAFLEGASNLPEIIKEHWQCQKRRIAGNDYKGRSAHNAKEYHFNIGRYMRGRGRQRELLRLKIAVRTFSLAVAGMALQLQSSLERVRSMPRYRHRAARSPIRYYFLRPRAAAVPMPFQCCGASRSHALSTAFRTACGCVRWFASTFA